MNMIKRELLLPEKIKQVTTKKLRVYETPNGSYPSVTTVLANYFGSEALDKWRAKIGHDKAEKISFKAKCQGNEVHQLIENYLMERESTTPVLPMYQHLFLKIKPFLQTITTIYGVEHTTYSDILQTAGTVDLISEYNNRWKAVTDFKTSLKKIDNDSDKLLKYKLQATTYSLMIKERHNIDIPYGIIVVMIPEEVFPQTFIFRNDKYESKVREIFEWAKEHRK